MNFDLRLLRNMDWWLILAVLLLCGIGLGAISSASVAYINPRSFLIKQVAGMVLGLVALVVILLIDYSEYPRMYRFLYFFNLVLLTLVFVPFIGIEHNGARSWINLKVFELQPAELTKLFLVLTLGYRVDQVERYDSWWDLVPGLAHIVPAVLLVVKQPDLGTTLVILAITAAMLYMAGAAGWRFAALAAAATALVAGLVVLNLNYGVRIPGVGEYQFKRIQCWVNPESDPQKWCYNVYQSKVAVGSGGLTGKGLRQGTQTQLGFVPENITDFIFSVVGEELGFVGGAGVLVLFLVVLWRILNAAMQAKDRYGALLCTGVAAMIGFHVLENAGMAMGVMPVTGIPLPFISYGPTAVVANMAAIGLVLNVHMRRQTIMF